MSRVRKSAKRLVFLRLLSIASPIVAAAITLSLVLAYERLVSSFDAWPVIVLLVNMILGACGSAAAGFYSDTDTATRVARALGNLLVGLVAYALTIVIVGSVLFS